MGSASLRFSTTATPARRNTIPTLPADANYWQIDEINLVANLNTNGDMGSYSFAVGSAQLLKNGSLSCDSGFINGLGGAGTDPETQSVEMDQQGNFIYSMTALEDSYRTFRMQDLYTAINP